MCAFEHARVANLNACLKKDIFYFSNRHFYANKKIAPAKPTAASAASRSLHQMSIQVVG